jgi:hypothetical protein
MFYLAKFTPHTEMQHRNLLQLIKLEHFVPCSERDRDIKHLYAYKDTFLYRQITLNFICAYIPIIMILIVLIMSQNVKNLRFCVVW